jgi:glycosyltransferase involved in cell wall biosynthesis
VSATTKRPIRVLQVIAGLDPTAGGPPASAVSTSIALRSHGVLNSFAYVDGPGGGSAANAERLLAAGVPTQRFPVTRATGSRGVRWGISVRLAAWLIRHAGRFDVLHLHGAWTFPALAGLIAARLHRQVAVLTPHESLTDFDRAKSRPLLRAIKRALRRAYLASFDTIVVSSPLEQRDSGDAGGRRTVVIPHAVRGMSGSRRTARPDSALRVGFLGRLHPKKNLELLIAAIAAVDEPITLIVAGEGVAQYAAELHQLATEIGIADRVIWLGFVDGAGKDDFLGSIDVLAMPSAYECFGVSAVEAMSAGVPVIVSATVGISDVVRQHGAGVVVLPDRAALAAELRRFATDRAALVRAGAAAILAAGEFSLERHQMLLRQEYLRLLSNRRRRTASRPGRSIT